MVLWRRAAAAQGKPPHAHQPQWWRIRGLKQRISTTTSGASTPLTTTSCPNTRGGGPSSHRADPPSSWVRRKLRRRRRGHGSTKKYQIRMKSPAGTRGGPRAPTWPPAAGPREPTTEKGGTACSSSAARSNVSILSTKITPRGTRSAAATTT